MVWEYNYVNKMFIEHYKRLSSVADKSLVSMPSNSEIIIFGGYYPLSISQVSAIVKIIDT